MKTIIHVLGARPNFIKAAPLIKKMNESLDVNNVILHTGQHYDKNMSGQFFIDLNIPKPDVNLGLGGGSQASQTANIMIGCEKVFKEYKPKVVVVYGDVNSCVAATLVASKLHLEEGYDKIKVVHVESGLRSYDRTMPEELNRVVTDGLADYLFVSCEDAIQNLVSEGVDSERCFLPGIAFVWVALYPSGPRPSVCRNGTFSGTLGAPSRDLVTDPEFSRLNTSKKSPWFFAAFPSKSKRKLPPPAS